MGANLSPVILLDAIKREQSYREAEGSLIGFTKHAFSIVEPGVEFNDNWHLHAIAEHLEAVSAGEIKNLLVNIPPGCMKSILVSVMWPSWEWLLNPTLRYLGASYGADLAIRDAMKTKEIITSEWYAQRWGERVQIKQGQDQKVKYELNSGGWRIATSVGGRATGEHPDRKIVDDPHSAAQADSDAERLTALNWFDRTLATRGESRGARTVVVMQRLHEQDLAGHILADVGGYEHLCLPMEYDESKHKTSIGFSDPRTIKGGPLWPEMFGDESIARLKKTLGTYASAGQLQQRPSPEGGGILKEDYFQLWPAGKDIPEFMFIVQSWDTAFSEDKTANDPSAMTAWGVFAHNGKNCVMLLDVVNEHMAYPVLKKRVIDEWSAQYGPASQRASMLLIEKKASGQSIIQDLRTSRLPVVPYNPGRASKTQRTHAVAPIHETCVVYIRESSKEKGSFVKWAREFVAQTTAFPTAAHDDIHDTYTQALSYLRDAGWISTPSLDDEDEEEYADDVKPTRNPYAS